MTTKQIYLTSIVALKNLVLYLACEKNLPKINQIISATSSGTIDERLGLLLIKHLYTSTK